MKKIALLTAVSFILFNSCSAPMTEGKNLEGLRLKDGIYIGEASTFMVSAKTEIEVANGKISKIVILEHKTGKGKKAESIIDEIIKKQSTNVDVVTGATTSSTIIQNSVNNAVKKALIN